MQVFALWKASQRAQFISRWMFRHRTQTFRDRRARCCEESPKDIEIRGRLRSTIISFFEPFFCSERLKKPEFRLTLIGKLTLIDTKGCVGSHLVKYAESESIRCQETYSKIVTTKFFFRSSTVWSWLRFEKCCLGVRNNHWNTANNQPKKSSSVDWKKHWALFAQWWL